MPARVTQVFPEAALERILESLERELVEATDEEVLEAAHDLGMKPQMKGSAAFLGLRYRGAHPPWNWLDPGLLRRLMSERIATAPRAARRGSAQPAAARATARTRSAGRKTRRPPKEPGES